jgi:hypothetical protein
MKWTLLSLWLLGAGLYAAVAFSTSHSDCTAPAQSAAAVIQDDTQQASRVGTEPGATDSAPATQETVPNDPVQVQAETTQSPNRQASITPSNGFASVEVETAPLAANAWGEMLRGAPIHSGPDVSSAILGYVAAGTDMQLLRRELGWVKVLDPATARQGWIYEQHIIAKAGPDAIQEVAAADEAGLGPVDEPTQSFKSQKSRKNYVSKKRRHYGENRRRKVIGFFRFRRF